MRAAAVLDDDAAPVVKDLVKAMPGTHVKAKIKDAHDSGSSAALLKYLSDPPRRAKFDLAGVLSRHSEGRRSVPEGADVCEELVQLIMQAPRPTN